MESQIGCGLAWSAQEPKAMRESGARPWAARVAGARAAAAMSWARVRRLNIKSPKCQDVSLGCHYRETPPQIRARAAAHAHRSGDRLHRRRAAALPRAIDGGSRQVAAQPAHRGPAA